MLKFFLYVLALCVDTLFSGKDDVVDRDEDQFDDVANETHDDEAHHASIENC